jgi:hypothetical protein
MPEDSDAKPARQEEGQEKIAINELARVRSPHFVAISSNNANATRGFFDITLLFSEIVLVPGTKPQGFIEDRASVEMSWEHAKALYKLLGRSIEYYEEKYQTKIREQPEQPETSA